MLFVPVHCQGMVENPDFASWELVRMPLQNPGKAGSGRGLFVS